MGLGELALADGETDRATELVTEALRLKIELDDRMGIAVALDCLARIALAEGRPERATVLLGAGLAIWDAIGMRETGNPFSWARSPAEPIHRARGMLGKSAFRSAFRQGSDLSREQAIHYALTDEVAVPPVAEPAEPSPLTRRELEVAELVAEGLSNPQIAQRLVISVRTAQGHVENILRKLGFGSRAMIAAWVVQRRAGAARA
jgi:DNA-binding CsgD family transcriptional regulator